MLCKFTSLITVTVSPFSNPMSNSAWNSHIGVYNILLFQRFHVLAWQACNDFRTTASRNSPVGRTWDHPRSTAQTWSPLPSARPGLLRRTNAYISHKWTETEYYQTSWSAELPPGRHHTTHFILPSGGSDRSGPRHWHHRLLSCGTEMEEGPRGTRARPGEVEAAERAMTERASRNAAAGVAAIGAGGENGEIDIISIFACGFWWSLFR